MPVTSCIVSVLLLAVVGWATWTASGAEGADAPPGASAAGPARATVNDLAWIAGAWRSADGDEVCEETWSAALGGAMVGTFRMVAASKPVFYEFLLLEEEAEGVVMRLRHFHPGMKAWESDKDGPQALRLVEREGTSALFRDVRPDADFSLRYAVEGAALTVTLKGRRKDGKAFETTFRFTK